MTISAARRIRFAAALPLIVLAGIAASPAPATAAGPATQGVDRGGVSRLLPSGLVVNPRDYPASRVAAGQRRQPPHLSRAPKQPTAGTVTASAAPGPVSSNATLGTSFAGASFHGDVTAFGNGQAVEPPDTVVAAGTSDLVEAVNSVMRITDKTGTVLSQTDLNNFFNFPNDTTHTYSFTDPRIEWDAADGRWFLTGFGFDSQNDSDMKIATSTSADPTGSWMITEIVKKPNVIADQPKLGFNSNVVTMAWDDYNGSNSLFIGNQTIVLQKSDLIAGFSVHSFTFADDANEFSVVPAQSYDGGTTGYATENDSCGNNSIGSCSTGSPNLELISITGTPAGNNVARSFRHLPMSSTVAPPNADQLGTNGATSIDTNDDRFLSGPLSGGVIYVTANDSCKPSGDSTTRPCVRLMEVNVSGTPALTVNTDIGFNGIDTYFGAAIPDTAGDVALAATESNTSTYPTSVLLSAVAGSTSFTSVNVQAGTVEYDLGAPCLLHSSPSYPCRWGDYSGAAIDPSQPNNLWLASEWGGTGTDSGWSTEVYQVSFPATKLSVSAPASTNTNQQFHFTVTAQTANGATAATYTGTVHFTSSDGAAVLPADYTFQPADQGTHTFTATLATRGTQTLTATDTITAITGFATIIVAPPPVSLSSTKQYELIASDGATWQPMDPVNLSTVVTPAANQTAVITANADLWTAVAGYNQDIGIDVTPQGGGTTLVAWHESGGYAGTYSPNAAAVQGTYAMTSGVPYTITVVWKANVPNGAHGLPTPSAIFAAAGGPSPAPFSPTTLTVFYVAPSVTSFLQTTPSTQYVLSSSQNPMTWQAVDLGHLSETITPASSTTMYLSANADMWTTVTGVNQDLGILVSPPCVGDSNTAPTPTVWKESGGRAGTYSPNAAFVQDMCSMTGGQTYTVSLEWKTNVPIPSGGAIYMAAGNPGVHSPTTLFARPTATAQQSIIATQPTLNGSDGSTWQPLAGFTPLTLSPGTNCAVALTGNADLWTANAGFNQDIGIRVTPPSGPAYILAWKESGGYAGTYSPNAAFVQGVLETTSSSAYSVTLVWKTNIFMPGNDVVYVAAGGPNPAPFSPTTLDAQTSC